MNNIYKTIEENYILFEKEIIPIIIDQNGILWIHANNFIYALGYKDVRDVIKKQIGKEYKKEINKIDFEGQIKGHPQTLYINEAGMYKLILTSKMPKAKKFNEWVTKEILPSIRKYGSYKMQKEYKNQMNGLMEKLNYLENENKKLVREMRKEKYPEGGIVYAIDYSDKENEIYRIGMTGDMNKRKQLYDTHLLNKHEVVILEKSDNPIKLETCIRSMLYDYRYKNHKDFYLCNLKTIKCAFNTCKKSIENMNQKGGGLSEIDLLRNKISRLENKINKLDIILIN